ncbi:MAG: Malate/L-lactate dehydrogenase [Xanthobacteraceae bacterium]|nr:Malate/L-lactate dehydrogenase [Xanthobacteraceae bacterium]
MNVTGHISVSVDELKRLAASYLCRHGMSEADALIVSNVLVWADIRGHESHGVSRVLRYSEFIKRGDLDPTAKPEVEMSFGALLKINGRRAAGPVAMEFAVEQGLNAARATGIAWTSVAQTTHTGPLGFYVERIAREGMVGIAFAAGTPLMAYHGSIAGSVSTSPLAIGVPMENEAPFVLDMATSIAAHGKLREAEANKTAIPNNWALDKDGLPTTNPGEAKWMLPLGGPKGSGLALAFELICSIGGGVPILQKALRGTSPHVQNAAICIVDIGRLRSLDDFQSDASDLKDLIKALPKAPGVSEILMPGERASALARQRTKDGLSMRKKLIDALGSASPEN